MAALSLALGGCSAGLAGLGLSGCTIPAPNPRLMARLGPLPDPALQTYGDLEKAWVRMRAHAIEARARTVALRAHVEAVQAVKARCAA